MVVEGTHVFEARTVNGTRSVKLVRYPDGQPADSLEYRPEVIDRDGLYLGLDLVDTEVTGTVERNGTTLHRVEASGETDLARFAAVQDMDSVENGSFTALVDERGIVHQYRFEYTGVRNGDTITASRTVEYRNIGSTTVEQPSWVETARRPSGERTTQSEA